MAKSIYCKNDQLYQKKTLKSYNKKMNMRVKKIDKESFLVTCSLCLPGNTPTRVLSTAICFEEQLNNVGSTGDGGRYATVTSLRHQGCPVPICDRQEVTSPLSVKGSEL